MSGGQKKIMPAQDNIDQIALKIIGTNGIFVEAGCGHYKEQSNTFALEEAGWSGIAIDFQPQYIDDYHKLRPNTKCECCAIVGKDHEGDVIDAFGMGFTANCSHPPVGEVHGVKVIDKRTGKVVAKTLQTIFDEHSVTDIDFLSIDLEGYEHEAISGIDFDKTNIKLICAEMHDVPNYKDYDYMESLGYKNFYNSSPDGDQYKDVEWHKWFARKDVELDLNFLKEL
jgi:FkbM family methyltransferase